MCGPYSSNPLQAVMSHFCTLETATGSVCILVPAPPRAGHTGVLEGEEGWTKQLQCHPSPSSLASAFHWISFLISYASREQPSLHYQPALHTSCSDMADLLEPLLPCPLPSVQVAHVSQSPTLAQLYVTLQYFLPVCSVMLFTAHALIHRHLAAVILSLIWPSWMVFRANSWSFLGKDPKLKPCFNQMTYLDIYLQDAQCLPILPSGCSCLTSKYLGARGALDGLGSHSFLRGDTLWPSRTLITFGAFY